MDFNARVDVNCDRKDRRTENRTPILDLAKVSPIKRVFTIYGRSGHHGHVTQTVCLNFQSCSPISFHVKDMIIVD